MNYEQAVAYIHGKYGKGVKRGLDNMYALLRRLGNPHEGLRCIHVAGTNGKGSTCAFLDAALRAQGYRVGLYTSPFLMRYNERMRINGGEIPDETLAALTTEVSAHVQAMEESGEGYPTVFEIGTAIALTWFAREKVDAAVIEVGLGGTHDPTNVAMRLRSWRISPCTTATAWDWAVLRQRAYPSSGACLRRKRQRISGTPFFPSEFLPQRRALPGNGSL